MNNENHQQKIKLMSSILSNPKMAKQFRDALSSPIGSTKRENAKSIFSIMKKVGGLRNDGMGGPITPMTQNSPTSVSNSSNSNYYIFPAAPTLKNTLVGKINTGLGLSNDTSTSAPKTTNTTQYPNIFPVIGNAAKNLFTVPDEYKTKSTTTSLNTNPLGSNYDIKQVGSNILNTIKGTPSYSPVVPATSKNTSLSNTPNIPSYSAPLRTTNPSGITNPTTDKDSIKKLQSDLNTKNAGQPGWVPLVVDGIMGPKTNAAQNFVPQTNTGGTNTSNNNGGATRTFDNGTVESGVNTNTGTNTNNPTQTSNGGNLKNDAQQAINEGTGPGLFAMTKANEKFGGSLDQYIANLDTKLKNDFNLEPLEIQLSNLKAESENFVPTLISYIKGKDQYSKAIDKMIDSTEDELLSVDMSDPASVDRYNNYMNYLYTLKGRQGDRYGNYLNASIADYNADVTKLTDNYNNVYQRYSDAITRQGTIAQNEYNTLYTTMADLYTNLENAPVKKLNLQILQQQKDANDLAMLQNGITSGQTTNPDFWKDVDLLTKQLTDSNATGKEQSNLDFNKLGSGGLAEFFRENSYANSDPYAAAKAINNTFASTLSNSTDKMADLTKIKKLVTDLSNTEGGGQLASMISPSLYQTASPLISDYVLNNLSSIKEATNQLISGKQNWLKKDVPSGLSNPTTWYNNFSKIDKGILTDLYNTAKINITPGSEYEKNPSTFISSLFSGTDDKSIANNVTSVLSSTW